MNVYEIFIIKRKIMYHYVYRLEDPNTKEYYFGSRTSKLTPNEDVSYMGSMKCWKPDKTKLIKTIIKCDFINREECMLFESNIIIEHKCDSLNKNAHIPGVGFHTSGLGQFVNKNGKVFRVDKNDELVLNGYLLPFWTGKKHSEISKQKMSKSAIGKKLSDETKLKISQFYINKPKSEETKKKMSKSSSGDGNNYKRYLIRTGVSHAKSKTIEQFSLDGGLIREWVNANIAAKELNLSYKSINNCLNKKSKTSQGFIWEFKK